MLDFLLAEETVSASMAELLAGRYIPHNAIGAGNFSSVRLADVAPAYRETDPLAPATVALKSCPMSNKEQYHVLKKEWAAFCSLRESVGITKAPDFHEADPAILSAYDYFEEGGNATIVLELAPHGDLMTYLTRNSLTERQICRIMRQLLNALKTIHAAGYAHRDIKPHNVLVVATEPQIRTKLADLGLVKQVGQGLGLIGAQCSACDYEFRSPDVKDSMDDGMFLKRMEFEANDVYAAGMTMFCLVTGTVPNQEDQLRRSRNQPPMYPQLLKVSPQFLQVMALLLDQDPDDRPTAEGALQHPWFEMLQKGPAAPASDARPPEAVSGAGSALDGHGVEATVTGHITALTESQWAKPEEPASPLVPVVEATAAPVPAAAAKSGDDEA